MTSTDESPCVSIIIATYNWSTVLRYAIQSVLWQTLRDFEVLVIGDGCTDDSEAVAASFGDPRIRWHNLPQNSGSQSGPNNKGLELARGTYVAYLGHDDLWLPTHLALLTQAMRRAEADISYAYAVMVGPPGSDFRVLTGVSASGTYDPNLHVPPSSVMHKREMAREIGGWRDYRTLSLPPDEEFLERAWAAGKRFAPTNALTVWKFPSAWRKNSYRERRADEQRAYVRRMQMEPDFQETELLVVASSYVLEKRLPVHRPPTPDNPPPGWIVQQSRKIRGLEPDEADGAPRSDETRGEEDASNRQLTGLDFRPDRLARAVGQYARSLEGVVAEKDRQLREAERYARTLEQTIADNDRRYARVRRYAQTLERAIAAHEQRDAEAKRYTRDLERGISERDRQQRETAAYVGRLEQEIATNTETDAARQHLESYARSLEEMLADTAKQRKETEAYARTLAHAIADREEQRAATEGYIRALEGAIREKDGHIEDIERYVRSLEQRLADPASNGGAR